MITGINHIGIVVKSIDETVEFLNRTIGAVETERVAFPEAGQTSCIVQFGDSKYELMEPIGEEGVVADFLEKHGGGFHHISLLTTDFDAELEHLKAEGVKIIGVSETGGMRYAFTHPKTSGGILYEIAGK